MDHDSDHRQATTSSLPLGQFLWFLLCSGTAAVTNLVCGAALLRAVEPSTGGYGAVLAFSYCVGMIVNFLLNRKFTFRTRYRPINHEARTFLVVSLIGLGLTMIIGWIARRSLQWLAIVEGIAMTPHNTWLRDVGAQALTIGVVAVYSFVGHRTLTFAKGIRAAVGGRRAT
jgi:putative flippase GtrA